MKYEKPLLEVITVDENVIMLSLKEDNAGDDSGSGNWDDL